jgi:hypothetical protein
MVDGFLRFPVGVMMKQQLDLRQPALLHRFGEPVGCLPRDHDVLGRLNHFSGFPLGVVPRHALDGGRQFALA